MRRLIAAFVFSWLLLGSVFAQVQTPVQMRDANLATTNIQNIITTLQVFTAPRTLTIPGQGALNAYYIQFADTANAISASNTLTIQTGDGSLINGAANLVISAPGTYLFIIPNPSGYFVSTFIGPSTGLPGLANNSFWIGNSSNVATARVLSGDCTTTNLGVITCTKTNGTAFGALATLGVGTGLSSGGGNLNVASTVTAGGPTGSSSVVPVITYNAQGQITAVTTATITAAAIGAVPTSRLINTTSPITGGGDLSADRTIACATCLTANQTITLSGDVTGSGATAITTALGNIPTGTTQAGQIVGTNIAAPSTPAAAHVTTWMDSTDLRMHDKNASGTIGTTVVADTGASNNFLTAISAAGVISKAQPTFANLASTPTTLSGYGITSPLPVAQGGTALTSGTSGGVLAYTASGTLASSGALTANAPVIGGGAGVVPTVGSRSGNTTSFATTSGALTNAHVAAFDASGNIVDGGAPSGTGTVTSATCNGLAITTTGTCPEPFGFENCSIALSASAGALTINLLDASGATPSATSPCRVAFGNSTLTTGSNSFVSQTAALSTILASGNTMGVTSATAFRLYVGVLNNAGSMELWAYIASTATSCAPINANNLQTTQADSGSLAAQVYGSTTVRSNVAIKLLAEAEWSSTGLTAGTWTTTNLLSIRTFGPGIYKPCEIIRSFTTSTNSSTATTSSTAAATANTGSITLSSAANLVEVSASGGAKVLTGVSTTGEMVLRQGTSTNIGAGANFSCTGTNCGAPAPLGPVLDKPNTTSAQAYTVYTLTTDNVTAFTYPFNSISTIQGTMFFKEIKG